LFYPFFEIQEMPEIISWKDDYQGFDLIGTDCRGDIQFRLRVRMGEKVIHNETYETVESAIAARNGRTVGRTRISRAKLASKCDARGDEGRDVAFS
jgi:hypothetical protein